jgi:hypothetical protein
MRRSLSACLLASATFMGTFLALDIPEAEAARYYVYYRGDRYGYGERVHFGIDGNFVLPVANTGNGPTSNVGLGIDGRLGYRAGTRYVFLQPELLVGLQQLGTLGGGPAPAVNFGRGMAGLRIGGGRFLQPQGSFHLGAAFGTLGAGFAYDIGAALDLKFRVFNMGLHAAFNMALVDGNAYKWINVGPHIGFSFM